MSLSFNMGMTFKFQNDKTKPVRLSGVKDIGGTKTTYVYFRLKL